MLRDIRRRAAQARKLLLSRNAPEGSARRGGGNRLTFEPLEARLVLADAAGVGDLLITEINYHPFALTEDEIGVLNPDPNDPDAVKELIRDFEFIELKNISGGPIELGGVHFETRVEQDNDGEDKIKGIVYNFPSMVLGTGEMVVVANDPAVFRTAGTRYETNAAGNLVTPDGTIVTLLGPFEQDSLGNATHLSDGGDRILLKSESDVMIVGGNVNGFNYHDSGDDPWPARADGSGSSLQVANLAANPDDAEYWRNSSELFGTPGFEDEAPITDVVINEVLAHTDWPTYDAIELLNLSGNTTYDIDGWYLTDSNNSFEKLRKFEIPGATPLLGPGDYIVFDENQFNPEWDNIDPNADLPQHFGVSGAPSKTNSSGDILDDNEDLWLMKTDGDRMWFVDHVDFGASWNGETFGRTVSTANNVETVYFYPTRDVTLGSENSEPRVGPLVISEIMYDLNDNNNAPNDDNLDFIEIFNPTNNTTSLKHWQIRGGVQFDFPLDDANKVRVQSQSAVVVVKFDPSSDTAAKTAFLTHYGLSEGDITLVGPYASNLSGEGEKIRLLSNDEPPQNGPQDFYPHVVEDEVAYDDALPWPTQAGGEGMTINRIAYGAWGHQSTSWIAAEPSPGTPYTIMPPYAMDDTVTTASGTAVDIVVRANDIAFASSLDPASVVIPSDHQPEHGSWQINAGIVKYTPTPGFSGVDTFRYTIKDSDGSESNEAAVTVTVNDPPVATDFTVDVAPGDLGPWTVDVLAHVSDPNGDPLWLTVLANDAGIAAVDPGATVQNPTDNTIVFDPNFSGTATFEYAIDDGLGGTDTATVTFNILVPNDPPTALDDLATTNEDTPKTIDVLANDTDPDGTVDPATVVITQQAIIGAERLVVDPEGTITYTPASNFFGGYIFKYRVSDNDGVESNEATVTITVNPVNDAPTAGDDWAITNEDTSKTIDVLVNDTDPEDNLDTATVEIIQLPAGGQAEVDFEGTITYTPALDFSGEDTFTYRVSDDDGAESNEATVTITVNPVNDAPAAVNDPAATDEDQSVAIIVLANDDDPDSQIDPTSVTVVQQPADGVAHTNVDGSITYTPSLGFHGEDTFTYRVSDIEGAPSNEATVTVTVQQVSDDVRAEDDPDYGVGEDGTLTEPSPGVLGNDVAGGITLSAQLVENVGNGNLLLRQDGSFDYTPNPDFHGSDSFTYRAVAAGLVSNTATVTITVDPVNDAPVVVDHQYDMNENGTLIEPAPGVLAGATDVEGDVGLTAEKVDGPLQGSLTLSPNGSFTYVPAVGFVGTDSFTYRASDGQDDSGAATVTITVEEVNLNPPVAQDDLYVLDEGGSLDVAALGVLTNDTDADGDLLSAALVQDVAHGTLDLQPNGSFTYTPDPGFNGTDTFAYRAGDGQNESNTATASISVVKSLDLVDFRQVAGLDPVAGDHWYRFTAMRAGTLTAQLVAPQLGPNTRIVLYADLGNGQRQELAEGDARVDFDVAFGGQPYLLLVTGLEATADLVLANLVQFLPGAGHVLVFGSIGDDTFEATLGGSNPGVSVNGIDYPTDAMTGMTILGGAGSDHITVTGTSSNEVVTLSPGMGNLAGLGYQVQWSGMTTATVYSGGGDDAAFLYDSPGDDEFTATPTYAAMVGDGFENTARFFNSVHGQAVGGGNDLAKLIDSEYDDHFVSTPTYGALYSTRYYNRAWYFDAVHAYASNGGIDVAKMFDSPGDDTFYADPEEASLYRTGEFYSRAKGFDGVHAYATNGGTDVAELFDSAGDDIYYTTPLFGALFGDGFYNRAKHFEQVYGNAGAGGSDQALLYDSESVDLLEAEGNWARLSNAQLDFLYEAIAFGRVKATASSNDDEKIVPDLAMLDFVMELEGPWKTAGFV
ncbi:MAG: Ig-like domain-containing protein [Thermoguttaceae bacterium]